LIDAPTRLLRQGLPRQRGICADHRKILKNVRGKREKNRPYLAPCFVAHERSVVPSGPCRGSENDKLNASLLRHTDMENGYYRRIKEAWTKTKSTCPLILSLEFAFAFPSVIQCFLYGLSLFVQWHLVVFACVPTLFRASSTKWVAASKTPKEKPARTCPH
jgi:hypothetical protein